MRGQRSSRPITASTWRTARRARTPRSSGCAAAHNRAYEPTSSWSYGPAYQQGRLRDLQPQEPRLQRRRLEPVAGPTPFPDGLVPGLPQPLGVYDLNGNAAEHMNLPLDESQMASRGSSELGYTEMKGSWFIFDDYPRPRGLVSLARALLARQPRDGRAQPRELPPRLPLLQDAEVRTRAAASAPACRKADEWSRWIGPFVAERRRKRRIAQNFVRWTAARRRPRPSLRRAGSRGCSRRSRRRAPCSAAEWAARCAVPPVNRNLPRPRGSGVRKHHILLVARETRAARKETADPSCRRSSRCASRSSRWNHLRTGGQRCGVHGWSRLCVDGVHHLSRRQQKAETIRNSARRLQIHRDPQKVAVRSDGEVFGHHEDGCNALVGSEVHGDQRSEKIWQVALRKLHPESRAHADAGPYLKPGRQIANCARHSPVEAGWRGQTPRPRWADGREHDAPTTPKTPTQFPCGALQCSLITAGGQHFSILADGSP